MKLSTLLVLVPVAIVAALFAVANRQEVIVRIDPFAQPEQALAYAMPVYLLAFFALLLGVVLGGVAVSLNRHMAGRRRLKAAEIGNAIVGIEAAKPAEEKTPESVT